MSERVHYSKAQGQGMKRNNKFQNAKPTQLQFGETALQYMSFAAKLRGTAVPNQALLWKPLLAAGCLARRSGGNPERH